MGGNTGGVGLPSPQAEKLKVDYDLPIAFLDATNEELRFSWNSQNPWAFGADQDKNLTGQLSNCILLLRKEEEQHAIHLRLLEHTTPLLVKLEEKDEEKQHSLHNLPPRKSLALKLTELDGFGTVTEMIPGDGLMGLDDRGRVELYVGDQKEIRLRVEGELVDDGVRVSLSSYFKSGDSYKPLTPKLAKQELTLKQRLLGKGEGDLAAAKQEFKGADAYRRRLGGPPNDPRKQFAWQKQVGDANSAMKRAEGKITRNTNMIASLREVVAALEKMGELATTLQKNSPSISYLITTTIDGNERPLLVAGRDYSQSTAASISNTDSPEGFGEPMQANAILLAHHLDLLQNPLFRLKTNWSRGYYLIEAADLVPAVAAIH